MRIYIKGLKSLGGENYIALGKKLTFLVGPNSAGKSVLLMALDKLSGNWINREFDSDLIHTNPNRGDSIEGVQSLGVEWQHKKTKYGLFDSHCLLSKKELFEKNIDPREIHRSTLKFNRENNDVAEFDVPVIEYKQYYKNDSFLLQQKRLIKESSYSRIFRIFSKKPIDHVFYELVLDIKSTTPAAKIDLLKINDWILTVILKEIERLKVENSFHIEPKHSAELVENLKFLESLYDEQIQSFRKGLFIWWPAAIGDCASSYKGREKQQFTNIFSKNAAIIKKIERDMAKGFEQSYPGSNFECGTVSADRSIPTEKDLSAIVDIQSPDDMFREIMASEIDSTWINEEKNINNNEGLIHKVNRALRDDLFFDNGYQLSINIRALVSHEEWKINEIEKSDEERKFYCRISLRDSHGRSLDFKDVGSGIGYVLPVLVEIFRAKNNGKIVFLQQPELHLHPAMQANLTDVLIRAASGKRIIAETHSEHLILRALKRIRQTSSRTNKDPELELYPEDVAVNYFEPLGDGTTRVHILRVSSDGDFIDRWPNGFFAERDGELFDE